MAWIQTVFGYAVVGSIALVFVFRSYPELVKSYFPGLHETPAPKKSDYTEPKKPLKASSKPKPKQKAKEPEPLAPVPDTTTSEGIVEEEGENAVDFALSLKRAQTGTDLKKSETTADKPKKKKGKKGPKGEGDQNGVTPNGAQGHTEGKKENSSSIPSLPEVIEGAKETFSTGAAGMLSDIGTKAAESLRIFEKDVPAPLPREDEWTSVPTKNQKTQQKAAKQEETKKQRQRNAAKERERELVVQAEQERKKMMEAQLRKARIARGEPARNGESSSFREGPAPAKSAWNTSQQPGSGTGEEEHSGILDTLDDNDGSSASTSSARPPIIIAESDDIPDINGAE